MLLNKFRMKTEKEKSERKCLKYEQENVILKKQNKKLYDIMYEILGVVKLKSATNFGYF